MPATAEEELAALKRAYLYTPQDEWYNGPWKSMMKGYCSGGDSVTVYIPNCKPHVFADAVRHLFPHWTVKCVSYGLASDYVLVHFYV